MLAAAAFGVIYTVIFCVCAHAGAGKHVGTITTTYELFSKVRFIPYMRGLLACVWELTFTGSKTTWYASMANNVAQTFVKMSLLVFYIRLFPNPSVK
jgi:hypothetical protein